MTPEQLSREAIDRRLEQAGWVIQDMAQLNLFVGCGNSAEDKTAVGDVPAGCFEPGISYSEQKSTAWTDKRYAPRKNAG